MREERIARSFAGALIVLPVVYVILYMLLSPVYAATVLFYGLGCTLIGIGAGLLTGRKNALLQILLSALPAAALALALPISHPAAGILRYSMMGAGVLLAIWSERQSVVSAESGLSSGLLLMPLASLLVASCVLWFANNSDRGSASQAFAVIITAGSVWFVVAIFMMNRMSLRQAARAACHRDVPAGARRSGAVGVIVFLAAAFAVASIGELIQAIGNFLKKMAYWVIQAMLFLASLFPGGATGGAEKQSDKGAALPPANSNPSPLAELITKIIIVVVLLAVAAAILYGLYRLFPKLWRKLSGRLKSLFASWQEDETGYQDRAESLMSIRQAISGAGESLRKLARRFRRRPRIEDYKTNAGKARFLFREFLHGLVSSGRAPSPGATASDIARPAPALAQAYNRARYGEEEPSDSEIEKAKESIKK